MYTSPSLFLNEVGDHDVNTVDGRIHLHHLCLPSHDVVGHAVSDDGLTFKPARPALYTGAPGECDDDMIWTMHTVRSPKTGLYHMYYTACSLAENGQVQRVAMATSRDFEHWTKDPRNPVLVAAPPHYLGDTGLLGRVAFRDPFAFIDDDGSWHLLVCASTAAGDRLRRGCVAHAVSRDGLAWKLRKPLYAPCQTDDLEVPALLKHKGRYYLFVHELRTPRSYYRVADSLEGPWVAPAYDEPLPDHNCVNRFCRWKGATLMYTWYRCEADWPRSTNSYASVLPPKEVHFDRDGALRMSTFGGWRACFRGRPRRLAAGEFRSFREGPAAWRVAGGRLRGDVVGQLVGFAAAEFGDFVLDADLQCDRGRAAGLVFRASANTECGNWARLDFERQRVELHRLMPRDTGLNRTVRMQPSLRQSFDFPLARGRRLRLHLVASREYVELSINGRICLSTATYAQQRGRLGFFLENAAGSFGPVTVQPITAPASGG